MQYIDHRLSKILSDIRIEQARKHRQHKSIRYHRLGSRKRELSLIEEGERRAKSKPRAA